MMSDARRLVRPEAVAQWSAAQTATDQYCQVAPEEYDASSRCIGIPSSSGSARTEPALERLELCEGKLSRTVLRGVWAG